MKKISLIAIICCLLFSCQSEEDLVGNAKTGYLRLQVNTVTSTTDVETKADSDPSLTITILKSDGTTVVKTIADHKTLTGEPIELEAGQYIINAASAGMNGTESGFNTPYYFGTKSFSIRASESTPVTVTCSLANVKVSVNFSSAVKEAFLSANVQISSALSNVTARSFKMNEDKGAAYFPVGGLTATLVVVNKAGQANTMTTRIPTTGEVKARYHYILNYTMKSDDNTSGSVGGVTVTADDKEKWYKYEIPVSSTPTTSLMLKGIANAWSNFAYVEGVASFAGTFDASKLQFEYQKSGASGWQTVVAEAVNGNEYKAKLSGLDPNTQYQYRLAYRNGSEEYVSGSTSSFITETQNKIPNLNFDGWNDSEGYWTPNASGEDVFWDTANGGTKTVKIYPTEPEEVNVKNGKAVKLKSLKAPMVNLAAGNIYTGKFKKANMSLTNPGAELDFGQSFNERPTQLKGWYMYQPGTVDYSKNTALPTGSTDMGSIYIVLTDWDKPFAVSTSSGTFLNPATDPGIIAYGELSFNEMMEDYSNFTIDLKYRSLTRKPTHILIVCSASKYGDYFTGSTSSVLYVDEFDLIYGEPTIDTNYIN